MKWHDAKEEQIQTIVNVLFENTTAEQLPLEKCYELAEKIVEKFSEMIDLLFDGVAITRQNADGTIERCSPSELIGKDLEIVSVRDYSFQDIKNEFEQS